MVGRPPGDARCGLVSSVEHDLTERAVVVAVGNLRRVRAVHPRGEHLHRSTRHDASKALWRGDVFETHRISFPEPAAQDVLVFERWRPMYPM